MAVYLFGLALCLISLTLVGSALQVAFRVARRLVTLRQARFSVSVEEARPGETIEARAHVVPRPLSRAVIVSARLTCTMFDHRSHQLYVSSREMRARGSGKKSREKAAAPPAETPPLEKAAVPPTVKPPAEKGTVALAEEPPLERAAAPLAEGPPAAATAAPAVSAEEAEKTEKTAAPPEAASERPAQPTSETVAAKVAEMVVERARGPAVEKRAGRSPAPHDYVAKLTLPDYALRTGLVGDQSPDAVEGGRRMLVAWTVDFEVRSATGRVLCRESRGLDVPRGRRPKTHLRRMSLLAIDTFTSIRNDMLLNWLVHLAICDGAVAPAERRFIHDLLEEMAGMAASAYTDARIEHEKQRRLVIDDLFLGRYLPMESRLEFYRALHGLARCDGAANPQEEEFLAGAAKTFRLTDDDVKRVRRESEVAADEAVPVATK